MHLVAGLDHCDWDEEEQDARVEVGQDDIEGAGCGSIARIRVIQHRQHDQEVEKEVT